MVAAMPNGTIVSAAMLEAALRLLPLQIGWEDSTSMLSVSLSGNTVIPTRLSVIGEDRVPRFEQDAFGGVESRLLFASRRSQNEGGQDPHGRQLRQLLTSTHARCL